MCRRPATTENLIRIYFDFEFRVFGFRIAGPMHIVTSPRGDVGDVTFFELRFSQCFGAIRLALGQKVTSPTSPTSPAFSATHFFLAVSMKKRPTALPYPSGAIPESILLFLEARRVRNTLQKRCLSMPLPSLPEFAIP
jgi:hypothetical protein